MIFLKLIYALLLPVLAGTCLVNILLKDKEDSPLPERIALGFLLGLALITLEMFYIFPPLNIRFSALFISISLIPIIIWGSIITIKKGLIGFKFPDIRSFNRVEQLLLLLLALQITFIFTTCMIKPVFGWDAFQQYSFRAKAYFIEGTTNIPALPHTFRGQFNGLQQTWVFECIGKWDEILGKINFPFMYLSLLIIFYSVARRFNSRMISLLSTCFIATPPFLVYHATLEYCDFPLSVYLFAGASLLYICLNNPRLRYFILGYIFILSCLTIKNEGFFHVLIVSVVLTSSIYSSKLNNIKRIDLLRRIVPFALASVVLLITYIMFFASNEAGYVGTIEFGKILAALAIFADYIFVRQNFGIIWTLLILMLIFNHNKLRVNLNFFLMNLVLVEYFGFIAYYIPQPSAYSWLFFVTPAVRNILQFMPITVLLISSLLTLDMPSLNPSDGTRDLTKPKKTR